ncbi:MAG TPA: pyridoxamine 5'-phosphate oxidase family protein [Acidimicrobiales bacterium]|nr:pyridoxamine 5'-phosphate oxidase family protein [Acidimicrobiales bacterium]
MGRVYDGVNERLGGWIEEQVVFFVATAPLDPDGRINLSPKGNRGELAVLGPRCVAYLEQTGSGVETLAHLRENGRIVLMFCAFTGGPRIVRLHGRGRTVRPSADEWPALAEAVRQRGGDPDGPGVRSIVVVDVERVADSCGYGVPFMRFEGHRPTMDDWAERKGPDGIAEYQAERNRLSIDGLPGLEPDLDDARRTSTA